MALLCSYQDICVRDSPKAAALNMPQPVLNHLCGALCQSLGDIRKPKLASRLPLYLHFFQTLPELILVNLPGWYLIFLVEAGEIGSCLGVII